MPAMRVCVVSLKECWQAEDGAWLSSGGFPLQMTAIASLFDESTLVVLRGTPNGGGIPLPRGARVVALRRPTGEDLRRKLSVIAHLPYYLAQIARHAARADVVHAPPPGDIPLLGMLVALAMRKRLLVRYCGSWESTSRTTVMNRVTRGVMRRFAGGRNVMFATGVEGAAPPARNIRWIFSTATSPEEVAAVDADLDRAPGDPLALTYVGRLSPEKGLEDAIAAVARLRDALPPGARPPRLTIVGDGVEHARLRRLVDRLQCADLVEFVGQRDRDGVIAVLRRTDVCVLASLTESFGKARIEAMLCGAAVLTTPVGFGREIVGADGERGWIVPTGDPDAIAATLRRLLVEPPDWPALRRRCRAYAERLTLQHWAEQIAAACAEQWGVDVADGGKLRP
jgi:glycosyltransferase involved in cell wall biosynthesis